MNIGHLIRLVLGSTRLGTRDKKEDFVNECSVQKEHLNYTFGQWFITIGFSPPKRVAYQITVYLLCLMGH